MDALEILYKLFALSYVAEREAYRNVERWETLAAAQGKPEPQYATDKVYASLIDEWDEAHKALKKFEGELMREYRKQRAAGTFVVMA